MYSQVENYRSISVLILNTYRGHIRNQGWKAREMQHRFSNDCCGYDFVIISLGHHGTWVFKDGFKKNTLSG